MTGTPSLTTATTSKSPVGSYPITAVAGTLAAANYSFTFKPGTLTVTKAILTVAANSASKIYGAALPIFSDSETGFVSGDTVASAMKGKPNLATTATAKSAVGSYPITATAGTLSAANYSFTFKSGTLTRSPKEPWW